MSAKHAVGGAGNRPPSLRSAVQVPSVLTSTFTATPFNPDISSVQTSALASLIATEGGSPLVGKALTYAQTLERVSAALSLVTVEPAEIADDGVTSATITVTILDTDGNPVQFLPAANVVLASTGSGNTITQPSNPTNTEGVTTGSIVSTGAATKTLSATALGIAVTDTASLDVTGSAPSCPTFHAYNNSSEDPTASADSNVLHDDDFCRGFGVKGDAEGKAGPSRSVTVFTGSILAAGNVQYTAGLGGTIFYPDGTPYPAGTPVGDGRGGALYAEETTFIYSSGSSGEATGYNFSKQWKDGVRGFWMRFDIHFYSGYLFGAEKVVDFLHPGADSGITWGDIHINMGGSPAATGILAWQGAGSNTSYNSLATLEDDHWYSIQIHCDNTAAAGSQVLQVWCDDLGVAGTTVPGGGTPTLVLNRSDYTWTPSNGYAGNEFGAYKLGAYSNPGSEGTRSRTNIRLVETGGPILIRDD